MAGFKVRTHVAQGELNDMPRRVRRNVRAELEEILVESADFARAIVPVRTGYLRSSIGVFKWPSINNLVGQLEATAEYAGFVEYGTVKMPARPFMTPAAEYGRQQMNSPRMQRVVNR